jgi:hypothetical protein
MTLKLLYTLTGDGTLTGALVTSITGSSTYAGMQDRCPVWLCSAGHCIIPAQKSWSTLQALQ